MKYLIIILLFSFWLNIYSQTDCGNIIHCPSDATYPFRFCSNSAPHFCTKYFCLNDPSEVPPGYTLFKSPIPLCAQVDEKTVPVEERFKSDVLVFRKDKAIEEINKSFSRWACVCGKEDEPCACTILVYFEDRYEMFPYPNSPARAATSYTLNNCKMDCRTSYITINNTVEFTKATTGFPSRYGINDDFITTDMLDFLESNPKFEAFSFIDVVTHEVGHLYGLMHNSGTVKTEDCPETSWDCSSYGNEAIMYAKIGAIINKKYSTDPPNNGKSTGLTNYDKCYFSKIYCPGYVPVNELETEDEIFNTFPNPTDKSVNIEFSVDNNFEKVSVFTVNSMGYILEKIYDSEVLYSGSYNVSIDFSEYSQGTYFIYLKKDEQVSFKKVILVK